MSNIKINASDVFEEIHQLFTKYEKALSDNDVSILKTLFWHNKETTRIGMSENLYGYDDIIRYCESRKHGLSKDVRHLQILTLDENTAVTNVEYARAGTDKIGRQSQTWYKFPEGWKIISAHVSWMAS